MLVKFITSGLLICGLVADVTGLPRSCSVMPGFSASNIVGKWYPYALRVLDTTVQIPHCLSFEYVENSDRFIFGYVENDTEVETTSRYYISRKTINMIGYDSDMGKILGTFHHVVLEGDAESYALVSACLPGVRGDYEWLLSRDRSPSTQVAELDHIIHDEGLVRTNQSHCGCKLPDGTRISSGDVSYDPSTTDINFCEEFGMRIQTGCLLEDGETIVDVDDKYYDVDTTTVYFCTLESGRSSEPGCLLEDGETILDVDDKYYDVHTTTVYFCTLESGRSSEPGCLLEDSETFVDVDGRYYELNTTTVYFCTTETGVTSQEGCSVGNRITMEIDTTFYEPDTTIIYTCTAGSGLSSEPGCQVFSNVIDVGGTLYDPRFTYFDTCTEGVGLGRSNGCLLNGAVLGIGSMSYVDNTIVIHECIHGTGLVEYAGCKLPNSNEVLQVGESLYSEDPSIVYQCDENNGLEAKSGCLVAELDNRFLEIEEFTQGDGYRYECTPHFIERMCILKIPSSPSFYFGLGEKKTEGDLVYSCTSTGIEVRCRLPAESGQNELQLENGKALTKDFVTYTCDNLNLIVSCEIPEDELALGETRVIDNVSFDCGRDSIYRLKVTCNLPNGQDLDLDSHHREPSGLLYTCTRSELLVRCVFSNDVYEMGGILYDSAYYRYLECEETGFNEKDGCINNDGSLEVIELDQMTYGPPGVYHCVNGLGLYDLFISYAAGPYSEARDICQLRDLSAKAWTALNPRNVFFIKEMERIFEGHDSAYVGLTKTSGNWVWGQSLPHEDQIEDDGCSTCGAAVYQGADVTLYSVQCEVVLKAVCFAPTTSYRIEYQKIFNLG